MLLKVLRATDGVSGTFSAFVDVHYDASKLLRWEPVYNSNDVMLEWNQHPFSSLTDLTPNQTSVANVIDLELGLPVRLFQNLTEKHRPRFGRSSGTETAYQFPEHPESCQSASGLRLDRAGRMTSIFQNQPLVCGCAGWQHRKQARG